MHYRYVVFILLAAPLGGCVVERPAPHERVVYEPAPAERVVIRVAPPQEVVEEVPPPRPGFIWVRGYWHWNGARHDWVRGRWETERVGFRYVQPRWDHVGEEWHFTGGAWIRL